MEKKIESYEEACEFLKRDPNAKPDVSKLPEDEGIYIVNHYELMVINMAINKKRKPDYTKKSEWKYYPIWVVEADKERPSGFALSHPGCVYWAADTGVGSRFALYSEEDALYSAKQFEEKHKINQLFL
jgi:hypothetical protein